jgi:predicted nucleotidyltransferase
MAPFREAVNFLQLLSDYKVEYLNIGGAAVNVHGYTRATGDLDIWYNPTPENFKKLLNSIEAFGFDVSPVKKNSDLLTKGFIRIPLESFFIELLSIIDGELKFEESYAKAYSFSLEGIQVPVIGYDDLLQNKIMSRRAKDLEDIAQLERRKNKRK